MSLRSQHLRISDILSLLLNPSLMTGVFFFLLSVKFEPPGFSRLAHGLLAVVFTALIPVGLLFVLKARGLLSDVEMHIRSERECIYLLCAACYGLGAGLLFVTGASWPLWGFLAWHVPNTIVLIAVNRRLKVSIHTMVLTSLFVGFLMFYGKQTAPLGILVPVAAWARWDAGNHTPAELLFGALIGGALSPVEISMMKFFFEG